MITRIVLSEGQKIAIKMAMSSVEDATKVSKRLLEQGYYSVDDVDWIHKLYFDAVTLIEELFVDVPFTSPNASSSDEINALLEEED